jgi:hypothetical protein
MLSQTIVLVIAQVLSRRGEVISLRKLMFATLTHTTKGKLKMGTNGNNCKQIRTDVNK